MNRPVLEVADIVRAQGNRFLERYQSSVSYQQLKALRAIRSCRTATLGGHVVCHGCGYQTGMSCNSCR
jgi:Transposase zinc-binding domain